MDGFPPHGLGFLSNAHVRVSVGNTKLVTTKTTAILSGLSEHHVLLSPYDRTFAVGKLDLELLPSGHIPGAASLFVRWDDGHFLYTGPINPKCGVSLEPCGMRRSDVLITESRYGHPDFVFPEDREEVLDSLVEKCRFHLERDITPVLFVSNPLGKAQELAERFFLKNIPVYAHRKITNGAITLKKLGLSKGKPKRLNPSKLSQGVVLWLSNSHKAPTLSKLKNKHTILVSGEAVHPQAARRLGADESVVLSDHADFPSLMEYVEGVGAQRIALLPGRAHGFIDHLSKRNRKIEILEPKQLSMF